MPEYILRREAERGERFTAGGEGKVLVVRPVVENGIFWVNLKEDGRGDARVLHAGLPVEEGRKVGLNIWIKRCVDVGGCRCLEGAG